MMSELPFRLVHLFGVVLFFNVGVELGQIVIVAILFPLLYACRNASWYVPVVLKGGSVAIGLLATWWLLERGLGLG